MTVYSSNTSLILTDLLTRGHNYSFAVAVTDSTGLHEPWSDQLIVIWDGEYIIKNNNYFMFYIHIKVPRIANISWKLNQTTVFTADWEVNINYVFPMIIFSYYSYFHH